MRVFELLRTEEGELPRDSSQQSTNLPIEFQIYIDASFQLVENGKGIVEVPFEIHSSFIGESLHEKCLIWRDKLRFPADSLLPMTQSGACSLQ